MASQPLYVDLDFNGNQILNVRVQVLASDPASPVEGQIWYNSTTKQLKYRDDNSTEVLVTGSTAGGVSTLTVDNATIENIGTASDPSIRVKALGIANAHISATAAIALSKLATDPLARGNHTGTQLAATISDFDTQVRTNRLDQMAAPTADVNLNSRKITGLADPASANDAANKQYVDGAVQGLSWKEPVRAATTANVNLANALENGDAIDGVTLATGDRVLVKDQSAGAENGIYVVQAAGAAVRASDADSAADLQGAAVFVDEGTTNGNTLWTQTVAGAITVGTTALTWIQFGGAGEYIAGTGLTKTGNSFALTTPVSVANGGTNATDAATARSNLSAVGAGFSANVGDGSSTAITVTHSLNTRDVLVQVYRNSTPWDTVICTVERDTVNAVILRFNTAPTSNQFRVVISKIGA